MTKHIVPPSTKQAQKNISAVGAMAPAPLSLKTRGVGGGAGGVAYKDRARPPPRWALLPCLCAITSSNGSAGPLTASVQGPKGCPICDAFENSGGWAPAATWRHETTVDKASVLFHHQRPSAVNPHTRRLQEYGRSCRISARASPCVVLQLRGGGQGWI